MSDVPDVENEVAFAALGGWEASLVRALQAYCDYCRRLPPRELARRPRWLLDFDLWIDPQEAARGTPLFRTLSAEHAAQYLADRIKTGRADPYAILGSLARECAR